MTSQQLKSNDKKRKVQADASATTVTPPALQSKKVKSSDQDTLSAVKPAKLKKNKSSSDLDKILSETSSKKQKRKSDAAAAATPPSEVASSPAAPFAVISTPQESNKAEKKQKKDKESKKDKVTGSDQVVTSASTSEPLASAAPVASTAGAPPAPASSSVSPIRERSNPFLRQRTASVAAATAAFDPSQYPRNFDFAAMAGYLKEHSTGSSSAKGDVASSSSAAGGGGTSTSLSEMGETHQALLAKLNEVISAPDYVAPKVSLALPARRPMPSSSGPKVRARVKHTDRSPTKGSGSKEETIADAQGLTHVEMLATKLYQPTQLQWLKEEFGLKWKAGKFHKTEDATIDETIQKFAANNNMEEEDVRDMIRERAPSQADLYADLFVEISMALGDRPNRAVRKHVCDREERDGKGAWNDDEEAALDEAVALHQKDWKKISVHVGRPASNCRSHYALTRGVQYNKGTWNDTELQALQAAVKHFTKGAVVESKLIPWQRVTERMGTRSALQCNKKWLELQRDGTKLSWLAPRDDFELVKRVMVDELAREKDDDTAVDFGKMSDASFPYSRKVLLSRWTALKRVLLRDATFKLKDILEVVEPVVQAKYEKWVVQGSKTRAERQAQLSAERQEDTIDSDAEMNDLTLNSKMARRKPKPKAKAKTGETAAKGKGKEKAMEPQSSSDEDELQSSSDSLGSSD